AVKERVRPFCARYRALAPELAGLAGRIDACDSPEALLGDVLQAVWTAGRKLYLLVDEYDGFANRLLSDGEHTLYDDGMVKRTGFVRAFYSKLKTGTQTGALGRLFITGVTPLVLDDLASGFNIVTSITNRPHFNALAGFTHADVERALDTFLAARPDLVG